MESGGDVVNVSGTCAAGFVHAVSESGGDAADVSESLAL